MWLWAEFDRGSPSSHPVEIPKLKRPKGDINSWHPGARGIDVMCCKGLVHVRQEESEDTGDPGGAGDVKASERCGVSGSEECVG